MADTLESFTHVSESNMDSIVRLTESDVVLRLVGPAGIEPAIFAL